MKIVKLSDRDIYIPVLPDEALNRAINSDFQKEHLIVLIYSKDADAYEYHLGGSMSNSDLLWHAEQFKAAILGGRLDDDI